MKRFLIPAGITIAIILIGFLGYQAVLNFQELIKEGSSPAAEEETATGTPSEAQENKETGTITISPALEDKSILMIVAYSEFNEEEYSYLRNLFASSGGSIEIASSQSGAATGNKGGILPLSFSLEEADFGYYDALVFIGGSRVLKDFNSLDLPETAKEEISEGKAAAVIGQQVIKIDDFSGPEQFGMEIIEALTNL